MEAGNSGPRQSGFTSACRADYFNQYQPRGPPQRYIREAPNMAAATLISSAVAYHHQPYNPTFTTSYAHAPPPPAMPGIMSPDEPRRPPNDIESPQRQSLPSISEVFSGAKPRPYSPTTQTSMAATQTLPPPSQSFTSSVPSRVEQVSEPRSAVSAVSHEDKFPGFPQSQDAPPSGPPNSGYAYGEQRELPKPPESLQRTGTLSNPPPPPQVPYPQQGQLPPGQLPLSAAPPISPRHYGPPASQYEHHRPPLHSDEDYGMHRRYDSNTLNRHFEAWGYADLLQKIGWISRTISNFAEAYGNIASEQHGGHPIPERLPTEREVTEMLSNADYMKKTLENVRELVQATEKAREGGKNKGPYDDDDVSMYGDGMKTVYGIGEVKKRRGRAAPPGRCHSCNRIDTPEWRRGPDGARTLCNACGLHYAKLERKRQMEQRAIRPKAVE